MPTSSGAALQAALDELGATSDDTRFRLLSGIAIPPTSIIHYFAWKSKIVGTASVTHPVTPLLNCESVRNATSCHQGFCGWICFLKEALLLDESTICTHCTFYHSFVGWSHPADTKAEVLTNHSRYHVFDSSHHTSEVGPFTAKRTVLIQAGEPSSDIPSIPVRLHLPSQLLLISVLHTKPLTNRTPSTLPEFQPSVNPDRKELVKLSLTASESRRQLQKEASSPFIKSLSFTSLHKMRIPLCNHLSIILNIRYVLIDPGTASRDQTSVDELLNTIMRFDRRTQEVLTISCLRADNASKIRRLWAEARCLCKL